MGVPSISAQELRASTVPTPARTPSHGAPDPAPKEVAPVEKPAKDAATESHQRAEPATWRDTTSIRLHVDKETNRIIAQVVDENNEVVRQIPPEDALRIQANTRHLLGLLFDETV